MRGKEARKRQAWGLPWFRNHDGWWYVRIRGKPVKLARGEENREEALAEWHRLQALAEAGEGDDCVLWVVFEKFLEHIEQKHPPCYDNYSRRLQSFKDRYPELRASQLRVRHVEEWADAHKGWSDTTRNRAIGIILAALNWGANPKQGLIKNNPIRGMTRPTARSRGEEAVMSEEDFRSIFEHALPWMKDALLFVRQTGTRPVNLERITAATIKFSQRCVRLEKHKTAAKTGKPLVIPLTRIALEILARLAERYPDGPLFRTSRGSPLTSRVFVNTFYRLKKQFQPAGKNLILYGLRHTLATELLEKDVPEAKVAFILGHKGTAMIHHHYAHLERASGSIAEMMDVVINGDAAGSANPGA